MTLRIETERLTLRPMIMSDVEDLYEYQSNPQIVRYIPWPARTMEQVKEAAQKTIDTAKSNLQEINDHIVLVWELKNSGKVIGQSNMGLISKEHKTSNIELGNSSRFSEQGICI